MQVNLLHRNPSLIPSISSLHSGPESSAKTTMMVDGQAVLDTYRIDQIVSKNGFGLRPHPAAPSAGDRLTNCGLFHVASYFNHSCLPNACRSNIGELMIIRAARPIKKGEEICLSYGKQGSSYTTDRRSCKPFGAFIAVDLSAKLKQKIHLRFEQRETSSWLWPRLCRKTTQRSLALRGSWLQQFRRRCSSS
jgi:hypothetical protein